jgi:hypothetical protein
MSCFHLSNGAFGDRKWLMGFEPCWVGGRESVVWRWICKGDLHRRPWEDRLLSSCGNRVTTSYFIKWDVYEHLCLSSIDISNFQKMGCHTFFNGMCTSTNVEALLILAYFKKWDVILYLMGCVKILMSKLYL